MTVLTATPQTPLTPIELTKLTNTFKGDVIQPSSPTYAAAIKRWSTTTEKHALYITYPRDEKDIIAVLAVAKAHKLEIAIKRESPLELTLIQAKIAIVGGGALTGDIDRETAKHGLATVLPSCSQVGIGGYTIGGGYGWLSGEHGLAIDNLVKAKIVTANGDYLTLSSEENDELFWGIKGGWSNFGIVTEFHFKLHPQRETVFTSHLEFKTELGLSVIGTCENLRRSLDPKAGLVLQFARGSEGPTITTALFFNGTTEEGTAAFKSLYDIGPTVTSESQIPYTKLNQQWDHLNLPGKAYHTAPFTIHSNYNLVEKVLPIFGYFSSYLATTKDDAYIAFEIFSHEKIDNPEQDSAFNLRGHHTNFILHVSSGAKIEMDKVEELVGNLDEIAQFGLPTYGNYESETTSQEKIEQLFQENDASLAALKAKHDPENIFNKLFPIKPSA